MYAAIPIVIFITLREINPANFISYVEDAKGAILKMEINRRKKENFGE